MKRSAKSLVMLITILFVLFPQLGRAQGRRTQLKAMDSVISVDFKECGRPRVQSPGAFNVSPDDVAKLLNGVWVGTRTLRPGTVETRAYQEPLIHYVMVYDMAAKESLILEEHGDSARASTFAQQYPAPSASAPHITYFYCGSPAMGAFRDDFVKVSDEPRLQVMEKLLGSGSNTPLSKLWESLRDTQYFAKAKGFVNAAFYTVSLSSPSPPGRLRNQARGFQDVRLDLAGQLRGSPHDAPGYAHDQPVAGMESGVFRSVAATKGNYLVSHAYAVPCNSPANEKIEMDAPPLTHFRYTKVVIGPIGNK